MVFPSLTDTFGLVNLEAMACGVPVAAFPVTGPIDAVRDGIMGVLDWDLASAARRALALDPADCRAHACTWTWDRCTREFESQLVDCRAAIASLPGPADGRSPSPDEFLACVQQSRNGNAPSSSCESVHSSWPSRSRVTFQEDRQ